jgi:ADP-heptose:LPS heptosyltransferase
MAGERGNKILRLLDKWAGVPLIAAAGLTRRRNTRPARELRRIGALCLGCIGDLVLFSGPLADVLAAHPAARLTVFCSKPNLDVARMIPGVAEVVVLPVKRPWEAVRLVRASGRFDAWIDSGQWPRLNALLSFAARAAFRVGFMSPGQHRHYVYDAVVPHLRTRHELDNFRALAATLGAKGGALPALVPLADAVEGIPGGLPQTPCAVLHAFPGGYRSHMKEWPLERWAEVAEHLAARGLSVLLSGGPADAPGNAEIARQAAARGVPVTDLSGVRVAPTALLLAHAALCVSVNTGIMHLAAAMGAPLVSLNGPVSVARWGAATAPGKGEALNSTRACAPCLHLGFEYGCEAGGCMADISVEEVLAACGRLLDAHTPGATPGAAP